MVASRSISGHARAQNMGAKAAEMMRLVPEAEVDASNAVPAMVALGGQEGQL